MADSQTDNDKNEYAKALADYQRLVWAAIGVSDASGGIDTSNQLIQATKLYTRIVLSSMTINAILPGNQVNDHGLWDLGALASLSRAFIELCHRFAYLSDVEISQEEARFRLDLFYYRLKKEKHRLYKELGAPQEDLREFELGNPRAKNRLKQSPILVNLDGRRRKSLLEGYLDMHLSDEEVANRYFGVEKNYSAVYRLLSNHTHGAPFATFSQSNERGRGEMNSAELFYFSAFIGIVNTYLARCLIIQAQVLNLGERVAKQVEYARQIP